MLHLKCGILGTIGLLGALGMAQAQGTTVIFQEKDFPVVDSTPVAEGALQQGFADARMVGAAGLGDALADQGTELLVMPYGSSYPETAWPAILRYLERGGNLIVLGGKPFTRAAYLTGHGWQLRAPGVAASLELFIADYQQTPGSAPLRFEANPDVQPTLPEFAWTRAFSPVIRLSATALFPSESGSTGYEDAALTALAWGTRAAHHRDAPAILVDHFQHRFIGGRWVFLPCEPAQQAFDNAQLLGKLRAIALRKNDRFTFRPRLPLFVPGEALEFNFEPAANGVILPGDSLKISVHSEDGVVSFTQTLAAADARPLILPANAANGKGLHSVDATLLRDGLPVWGYHSGFWMRDWDYLKSGPKLGVAGDYFEVDGRPLPVVGTTYMASDLDRLYLVKPNAYLWDKDMAQIHGAGLNMIRTGIWSCWSLLTNPDGTFKEEALRSIEAFLMSARHNNLPVQFTLFAFIPDSLGGGHPYLDPVAIEAQDRYVRSIAGRFHDVPFLAWDLINEPSANKNIWKTLPQYGPYEDAAWRNWLRLRYPDQSALLAAWSEPSLGVGRALQSKAGAATLDFSIQDPLALPDRGAFEYDGIRSGHNPLKVYDYYLFTQGFFADWVKRQRETIRGTGSTQLITVGQDEGGNSERLAAAFFAPYIDFTAMHTWWDYDAILWATLASKLADKPMLIQEMGEMRRLTQDDHLRLTPEEEGWQLERKLSLAFAQGAGGIEWAWDVDALMANDDEIPIGAVRPDGTEKPEVDVLTGFARFANASPESFTGMEAPPVVLVTPQSFFYSCMNAIALATQKKALRALAYFDHTPARMVTENRLRELGTPKLVILPSAQALTEAAWRQLLAYVERGGCLLVTGPVQRDEHWQLVDRMTPLNLKYKLMQLSLRQSTMQLPGQAQAIEVGYPAQVQQGPIEILRFADGASVQKVPLGKGWILWAADPVELAENYEPAAALYAYAIQVAGITPAYRQISPLSHGVLAFTTVLKDAVLYSFSSESLDDTDVDLKDSITHARLHFHLPAQRGAVILLRRTDGTTLASYGIEEESEGVKQER